MLYANLGRSQVISIKFVVHGQDDKVVNGHCFRSCIRPIAKGPRVTLSEETYGVSGPSFDKGQKIFPFRRNICLIRFNSHLHNMLSLIRMILTVHTIKEKKICYFRYSKSISLSLYSSFSH